jgi:hypothetical protein
MKTNIGGFRKKAAFRRMLIIGLLGLGVLRAEESPGEKTVQAIYQKGVYYAESTKYFFKELKTRRHIEIVDVHKEFRTNDTPKVTVPSKLLTDVKDDIAGTNPAMVGKEFTIHYGADGSVEVSGPRSAQAKPTP